MISDTVSSVRQDGTAFAMLSNSRAYMIIAPHVAIVPGLATMLVVLGFNLLGDGPRDSLDPRLRE